MSDSWNPPLQKKRTRRRYETKDEGSADEHLEDTKQSARQSISASGESNRSAGDTETPGYPHNPQQYLPMQPPPPIHQRNPLQPPWHPQSSPFYMHPTQQHYMPPYQHPIPPGSYYYPQNQPYYYGHQPIHHDPNQIPPSRLGSSTMPVGDTLETDTSSVRGTTHRRPHIPSTDILHSPIVGRKRRPQQDSSTSSTTGQQSFSHSSRHGPLDTMSDLESVSSSTYTAEPVKKTSREEAIILERKNRKNAQSRARAAKLRNKIKTVKEMSEEEKSDEQRKLIEVFEERRRRKNERSRERAIEKKEKISRILRKPEHERTAQEKLDLEIATKAKEKKNRGDRIRRERIKMMGLLKGKKPPLPRGRPRKRKDPPIEQKPPSPATPTLTPSGITLPSPGSLTSPLMMFPSSPSRLKSETISDPQLPITPPFSMAFTPPAAQRPMRSELRRSPRIQMQQRQQQGSTPLSANVSPSISLSDIHLPPAGAVNLSDVSAFLDELNNETEGNEKAGNNGRNPGEGSK